MPNAGAAPGKVAGKTGRDVRINDMIDAGEEIRVIDAEGENIGLVTGAEGLKMAQEAGLDLVEVAPGKSPAVCRILDYGKWRYQAQRRAIENRRKRRNVSVREIKIRPNIDTHDYNVKMRAIKRFFEGGDKVKVTLRFRGREVAHQELGHDLLKKVRDETESVSKVELEPKLEGRQMTMILAPLRNKGALNLPGGEPSPQDSAPIREA